MAPTPSQRISLVSSEPVCSSGEYVLYWMIANRRTGWNFSLQRAIEWGEKLKKPVVVLEALRCGYRWASDRIHAFVIQGMVDNARRFSESRIVYYPYLEFDDGNGRGLLAALAKRACVVISDDFPCFFLPRMLSSAATQVPVRFERVDSNGLYPMRATSRVFARAFDFRRHLQRELPAHLADKPLADPLKTARLPAGEIPDDVSRRWPATDPAALLRQANWSNRFPIDHAVRPVALPGGQVAAEASLQAFLDHRFERYGELRNEPEQEVSSGLSPYLHFGHLSVHQVFDAVTTRERWSPDRLASKPTGSAQGWWGTSPSAESFLDELITWRELGYNMCALRDDYDQYESLPEWARETLAKHLRDRRTHQYSLEQFEDAETHDALWNASQRQLVREGRIHNYLRMLWGKKILEWSATPRDALATMIELNNKYALDGRNPNSYTGIFWVLGRYDRAWGPERPIFGTIRFMSSENTARKVRVKDYLRTYASQA